MAIKMVASNPKSRGRHNSIAAIAISSAKKNLRCPLEITVSAENCGSCCASLPAASCTAQYRSCRSSDEAGIFETRMARAAPLRSVCNRRPSSGTLGSSERTRSEAIPAKRVSQIKLPSPTTVSRHYKVQHRSSAPTTELSPNDEIVDYDALRDA